MPKIYKDEVMGSRCSVFFPYKSRSTKGQFFWGTIREYHMILSIDGSTQHKHHVFYDDDDDEVHDLAELELNGKLRWPKEDGTEEPGKELDERDLVAHLVPDTVASVKRESGAGEQKDRRVKREAGSSSDDEEEVKPPPRPDGVVSSSSTPTKPIGTARLVTPNGNLPVARAPPTPAVAASIVRPDSPERKRPAEVDNPTTTTKKRRNKDDFAYPSWVYDMDHWLQNTPHGASHKVISIANANSVMRQVKKLVRGEGIGYKAWPDHVLFEIPNFSLRFTDFEALIITAKNYEARYGEDKGHGWLLQHPLKKLHLYQEYCRENGKF